MAISVIDCLFSPEAGRTAAGVNVSACAEQCSSLLCKMDTSGIARVLLSPCKRWKCERHWLCGEIQVDEVLQYVSAAPERFAALAGYNPYAITESLQQVERAIKFQDVRGVYVHTEASDVGVCDRRMYPLYAKAASLAKPVMIQVGEAGSAFGCEELSKVAADFPVLTIVAAWSGAVEVAEARRLLAPRSNVYAAFDIRLADDQAREWLASDEVAERCIWGSNGLAWDDVAQSLASLQLCEQKIDRYVFKNAVQVFQLGRPSARPLPPGIDIAVAER